MGQVDVAVDLFLTQDPERARADAAQLCELNRQRQQIESDIYRQAIAMLPEGTPPEAIVLADESWHQGVGGHWWPAVFPRNSPVRPSSSA